MKICIFLAAMETCMEKIDVSMLLNKYVRVYVWNSISMCE